MENRDGYKKTELGWIPEEWEEVKIGAFTTPVSEKNTEGEITDVVSVTKYNGIVSSLNYFNKQVYSDNITTYKIISRDQFAYATIHLDEGSIGYLHCYDKAVLSPMYTVFRVDDSLADKKFIFSLLKSDKLMNIYNHIGSGSINRRKSIAYSTFSQINISLPPLPEQQKIASILSTVDDKISSIEAQIQQTEQLKKGLMAKLLTEGIGHTEFKDTEIGRVPKAWEVTELSNIIKTTQLGINIQASTSKIGIPLLKMGNLTIGGFNFSKIEKISDTDISTYTDFILEKGDFLFNTRNSPELVGKSAVWKSDELMLFNSNILRIIFLENTNSFFIAYFFASDIGWKKLKQISKNTTSVGAIYSKDLLKIKIAIPPLPEQQEIASILSSVDDKLDVLQSKKISYSTLKKGLMAKLLTGQMRVKI